MTLLTQINLILAKVSAAMRNDIRVRLISAVELILLLRLKGGSIRPAAADIDGEGRDVENHISV